MKDIRDKIRNQTELFTAVDAQGNLVRALHFDLEKKKPKRLKNPHPAVCQIDAIPDSLKKTSKMDAAKAHSLLNHLWKCIPVTSYQHIEKVLTHSLTHSFISRKLLHPFPHPPGR